jgi:hypothetical protein
MTGSSRADAALAPVPFALLVCLNLKLPAGADDTLVLMTRTGADDAAFRVCGHVMDSCVSAVWHDRWCP